MNLPMPRGLQGRLVLLVCLVGLALGCGKSAPGSVSGKISFQGQPVAHGNVTFFKPGTGRIAQGVLGSGGDYALDLSGDGLAAGEYRVTVTPSRSYEKFDGPNGREDRMILKGEKSIPPKYRNRDSTPLSATITGGSDSFDFQLE